MRILLTLLSVLCVAVPTYPVMAQDVDNAPAHAVWVGIVVVILLAVIVLLASIMSSKRSHQD